MAEAKTLQVVKPQSPLAVMAARLSIDPGELESVIKCTVMPAKDANKQPFVVSNEMFVSFMAVANNYSLDPLKKEIYAFPAKGGGIQPVVSIDGWLSIINSRPEFDGMELVENYTTEGCFESVTCTIHRNDRTHPIVITECLDECKRNTDPWKKPKRMLRHKAAIQCARYAFGLGGIVEQDEAEAALGHEREVAPAAAAAPDRAEPVAYPEADFIRNLPKWKILVESGKKSPAEIIDTVEAKGLLSDDQKQAILDCAPIEAEVVS